MGKNIHDTTNNSNNYEKPDERSSNIYDQIGTLRNSQSNAFSIIGDSESIDFPTISDAQKPNFIPPSEIKNKKTCLKFVNNRKFIAVLVLILLIVLIVIGLVIF